MFSDSIDSKINKIKVNFDSYLNDKKKDGNSQPPVPSIRRPDQMTITNSISQSTSIQMPPPNGQINTSMAQSKPL
jgi:hypothetical protein